MRHARFPEDEAVALPFRLMQSEEATDRPRTAGHYRYAPSGKGGTLATRRRWTMTVTLVLAEAEVAGDQTIAEALFDKRHEAGGVSISFRALPRFAAEDVSASLGGGEP